MAHSDEVDKELSENTKFNFVHEVIDKESEIVEAKIFESLGECIL